MLNHNNMTVWLGICLHDVVTMCFCTRITLMTNVGLLLEVSSFPCMGSTVRVTTIAHVWLRDSGQHFHVIFLFLCSIDLPVPFYGAVLLCGRAPNVNRTFISCNQNIWSCSLESSARTMAQGQGYSMYYYYYWCNFHTVNVWPMCISYI